MPTKQEIEQIKKLAKQGKSINQITKQLQLPKSTTYYHFKKAVGQKQKNNQPKIPNKPKTQGELCGIFAGDGFFHKYSDGHYTTVITLNRNEEYWKILEQFYESELEKAPHTLHEEKYNRVRLKYDSKILYNFYKKHLSWGEDKTESICLKSRSKSKQFKIGLLRGLLDTDGHTSRTSRRSVFNGISINMADDVASILRELEIEYYRRTDKDKRENCRDMYRVGVSGNEAVELTELIEPRNPIKRCKFSRL